MLTNSFEKLSDILGASQTDKAVKGADLFSSPSPMQGKAHEVFRHKMDAGQELPCVILPESGDIADFFATVATYYEDFSPLSATIHILGKDTSLLFDRYSTSSEVKDGDRTSAYRAAALGVIAGEAALSSTPGQPLNPMPSYMACRRTLAFSLCRATLLYESRISAKSVAARWMKLRELTRQDGSDHGIEVTLAALAIAAGRAGTDTTLPIDPLLVHSLSEAARTRPTASEAPTSALATLYPGTAPLLGDLRGPFDGRMTTFVRLVEVIRNESRGPANDEIAIAMACNQILPGSFAHTPVLSKLAPHFPASLIWYGLVAALSRQAETYRFRNGLTAKLERDLLEEFSFERRPRCDIALEELEVLTRTQLRAGAIKPIQSRVALVALLPGIEIYTPIGADTEAAGERVRAADSEAAALYDHVAHLLEDALRALRRGIGPGRTAAPPTHRRYRKDR